MRLISPNRLQKKKLKEMVLELFPEYRYTLISSNGTISLFKSIWHLIFMMRKKVYMTDMCTVYLPERLGELHNRVFDDIGMPAYQREYKNYSRAVLDLLHHRSKGIIDYLYDEFVYVKHGIRRTYYVNKNILPEVSYTMSEMLLNPIKSGGIVLSRISNTIMRQSLKYWKDSLFKLQHPKLRSKVMDMWFNKNFKEELAQCYELKIRIAA